MKRSFLVVAIAFGLVSVSAFAHGIRMQMKMDGNLVRGQVLYEGNDPAQGVPVSVSDNSSRQLMEVVSDSEGRFEFILPAPGDYRIVAESIDGHRADEVVQVHHMTFTADATGTSGRSQTEEDGLSEQMDELIERIDHLENRTSLRDILGGIGYVVGLLGLMVLLKQRRNS